MSKITISFDGLCVFFTGDLIAEENPKLTVGLLDVTDWPNVPEADYHCPKITIKAARTVVGSYHDFPTQAKRYYQLEHTGEIAGDIHLDVPYGGTPIAPYEGEETDDKSPFSRIFNIEQEMFDATGQKLNVHPERCKARLHFRHGEVYSERLARVTYLEQEEKKTALAGMQIEIPDNGYATLYFRNNTNCFVFKGGIDYRVTIHNLPHPTTASEHNAQQGQNVHFKYYYNIFEPMDGETMTPIIPQPGDGQDPTNGGPLCMPGGSGGSGGSDPFPPGGGGGG